MNVEPLKPPPILALEDVTKRFGDGPHGVLALSGVSLALHPGRALALVGESGSGKTTCARLLMGMHAPSEGRVLFRGKDLAAATSRSDRAAFRSAVQMVFQDPFASLNPVHRVDHHIARPLRLHRHLSGRDLAAKIDEMLALVELEPALTARKYPHELSGGQRQRVNIARALATGAQVIIADEPTSMLDVSLRLGVLDLLGDLKTRQNVAFLYITHDIATARHVAEDIAVMRNGRIVEWGDAARVIDDPHHPYTQLLLSAVPDPQQRFADAPPASARTSAAAIREVAPAGQVKTVGAGHFVLG